MYCGCGCDGGRIDARMTRSATFVCMCVDVCVCVCWMSD